MLRRHPESTLFPYTPLFRSPLLQDPVWYVRAHAAEALGRIGDSTGVHTLAELLQDRSWWVRKNALDALVRIGEPSKPVLLRTLDRKSTRLNSSHLGISHAGF